MPVSCNHTLRREEEGGVGCALKDPSATATPWPRYGVCRGGDFAWRWRCFLRHALLSSSSPGAAVSVAVTTGKLFADYADTTSSRHGALRNRDDAGRGRVPTKVTQ